MESLFYCLLFLLFGGENIKTINRKNSYREDSPTYQIGITSVLSKKIFQRLLNNKGLLITPEQVGILNILLEKSGMSMQELSQKNHRDNSATTRIVDILEKNNFVQRKNSKTDRRINEIHITEKGKNEIDKANAIGREFVQQVVKGINEKDLDVFLNVIKSIRNNIKMMEDQTAILIQRN